MTVTPDEGEPGHSAASLGACLASRKEAENPPQRFTFTLMYRTIKKLVFDEKIEETNTMCSCTSLASQGRAYPPFPLPGALEACLS